MSHQKAIHGREKPYKCALCPYASSQKGTAIFIKVFFSHYIRFESGNLRAHVRRLHLFAYNEQQGDVHRCEDCSAVFRNVSSLTSHMSKFHCDTEQVCFIELLKISACYRFNCFFCFFHPKTDSSLSHLLDKNSDTISVLNVNGDDSVLRDGLNHKNDILQKALERIGLPLSDGGVDNSCVNSFDTFFYPCKGHLSC